MAETVVIYDAVDGAAADMGENYGARLGVRPWPVTSIAELKSDLSGAKQTGTRIDKLFFVTHGGPGWIRIGKDHLYVGNMRSEFGGQGFEDLFNPGAAVHFDGCNIAEVKKGYEDWTPDPNSLKGTVGGNGELFLLTFAQIFLAKAGGAADGWTSAGFGFAPVGGAVIHHWTGQHVYIFMKRGGSRWRFAIGRKTAPRTNQWWKVWSRGDYGQEEILYYQFQPAFVYWFTKEQYLRLVGSGLPPAQDPVVAKEQRGRWATDKEWLYINWMDEKGVPYANEQWDLPLFDEHQTGIVLDPHLQEYDLHARMLGYYE